MAGRIAIVVAMEREVGPLLRNWKMREIEHAGRRYRIFENGTGDNSVALICGGIGVDAARRATEAVIQWTGEGARRSIRPMRVISAGFAGALDSALSVGDVLEPRVVVNVTDGSRTDTGLGKGTLVSYAAVADPEQKRKLAAAYGAVAVDMEAAAVAQGAQARGVEFGALKAISDGADFLMPPTERFVSGEGRFRTGMFAMHVALRPWLWGRTMALARNSARASRALCDAIREYIRREATLTVEMNQK